LSRKFSSQTFKAEQHKAVKTSYLSKIVFPNIFPGLSSIVILIQLFIPLIFKCAIFKYHCPKVSLLQSGKSIDIHTTYQGPVILIKVHDFDVGHKILKGP
jgi:hypothetical protein